MHTPRQVDHHTHRRTSGPRGSRAGTEDTACLILQRTRAGNGRTGGASLGWQFRGRQGRMGPDRNTRSIRPGQSAAHRTVEAGTSLIPASPWRLRIPVTTRDRVRTCLVPVLQADSQSGGADPTLSTVGFPDSTVRESRDRVRAAIRNAGLEFPIERITVPCSCQPPQGRAPRRYR